jgi:hypothetical protein
MMQAHKRAFDAPSLKGVLHVQILWMHFLPADGFKNNTRHGGRIERLALLNRVIEVA